VKGALDRWFDRCRSSKVVADGIAVDVDAADVDAADVDVVDWDADVIAG